MRSLSKKVVSDLHELVTNFEKEVADKDSGDSASASLVKEEGVIPVEHVSTFIDNMAKVINSKQEMIESSIPVLSKIAHVRESFHISCIVFTMFLF